MTEFTVHEGRSYRASIRLSFLEQFAGNEVIASRLREAGFVDVKVTGDGAVRTAVARWPLPDQSAPLPQQVRSIVEIS